MNRLQAHWTTLCSPGAVRECVDFNCAGNLPMVRIFEMFYKNTNLLFLLILVELNILCSLCTRKNTSFQWALFIVSTCQSLSIQKKSPQRGIRQCEHTLLHPVVVYTHCLVQLYSVHPVYIYIQLLGHGKNKNIGCFFSSNHFFF